MVLLGFYNIGRFLPISLITLKKLPLPILGFLNPSRSLVMSQRDENKEKILKFLNSNREIKSMHNSVIVNALIDPSVPAEEKTIDRLLDEGQTILFAGVDTTARTLGVAMFHLLNDKRHLQKLRQELDSLSKPANQAWTVAQLEVLPFMVTTLTSPYVKFQLIRNMRHRGALSRKLFDFRMAWSCAYQE